MLHFITAENGLPKCLWSKIDILSEFKPSTHM